MEWVDCAGKIPMLHLHVQIVMEKADTVRVEQEAMDILRLQEERV
jgi:hypothetical protein